MKVRHIKSGEIYEVLDQNSVNYKFKDDNGTVWWAFKDNFEVVESDPITDIQKFQSELLDRIIKIEEELKLLHKPYFAINLDSLTEEDKKKLSLYEPVIKIEKPEKPKTPAPYELHTYTEDGDRLDIGFMNYDEGVECFEIIGSIDEQGKCFILSDYVQIDSYELWREKGMKVCSDKVEWKGKGYWIGGDFILHSSAPFCNIYCFASCFAYKNCPDDNIIRFKHNKRPILF